MNTDVLFSEFNLPPQTLSKLSFCGTKPKQLQELLDSLPSTQNKRVSLILYKLLPEINQLNIKAHQRIELLAILRPYVQHCIDGLADEFLKQPLSLVDSMTQLAAIAQALQRHLGDGFLIATQQLIQPKKPPPKELAACIYFAIRSLSLLYCRSLQLYVHFPAQLWKKLNVLFQLAAGYQLDTIPVQDNLLHQRQSMNSRQAYYQALALGCSQTNQLRQVDIMNLYHAVEKWSELIKLPLAQEDTNNLYWVNMNSDDGPIYRSRFTGAPNNKTHAVCFDQLIQPLSEGGSIVEGMGLLGQNRQALLNHLLHSWQEEQERHKTRFPTNQCLDICIGLKAGHQELLQGQSFEDFIQLDTDMSLFNSDTSTIHSPVMPNPQTITQATATDESSDGYCLRWSKNVPTQIKSGEVILLRKQGQDNWQAGSIRWTQRLDKYTYVGVQLLAPYAEPAAASTTLDNGATSPFFRSLLLKDELRGSFTSLLTPTIPFGPKQNIQLQAQGACQKALLTEILASSGSVSQFSYTNLR